MPPQIINPSQQVQAFVLRPPAFYTRTVAIEVHVADVIGAIGWAQTPKLAQNLRVISIDFWTNHFHDQKHLDGIFYIRFGDGKALAALEIINNWYNPIVMYGADVQGLTFIGTEQHFHWDVNEIMQADSRAMGLVCQNFTAQQHFGGILTAVITEG